MIRKLIPIAAIGCFIVSGILITGCARKRFICSTPEERAEFIVDRITHSLDLDKGQAEKLNKIKDEILARTKIYRDDREATRKELLDMAKSEKLDRVTVDNFISKREARMKEFKPFLIDKIVEFHNILTPEQRNRIAEKIDKFYHYCD